MIWTINLMYLILWTSLSGAIVSVIWFAIGRLLEKAGFLHITYTLLKVAILFWFVPITYGGVVTPDTDYGWIPSIV